MPEGRDPAAAARRRNIDEGDAWVIAYPDHVTAAGQSALRALRMLISEVLQPAITGCHVLPFHPSSGDGGFSVVDPAVVDERFGTWDDVRHLASSTAWMADAVVNHMSVESSWFRSFLDGVAPYDRFFAVLDPAVDSSAVTRPRTSPLTHPFRRTDGRVAHVWTTFSADQADLDYGNPDVLAAMIGVLLRYRHAGAIAIRLDAIAFVGKDPTTSSVSQPLAHDVVRAFRSALDAAGASDVVLVTETNVPHEENVAYLAPGEADAVYQFALPPLVAYAMVANDSGPLRRWLATIAEPPSTKLFLNFLASHDGIGLRPVEGILDDGQIARLSDAAIAAGGSVNWRTVRAGEQDRRPYELAVSWFALMASGFDEDDAVARHVAAHAIALALRGLPLLYLNSLFGVGNDVETYRRTGQGRDLNRRRLNREELDDWLGDESSVGARVWRSIAAMLAVRRSSPAFHPAAPQLVHDAGPQAVMIERRAVTGERALLVVNVSDAPARVGLPPGVWTAAIAAGAGAADGEIVLPSWTVDWLFDRGPCR